MVDHLHPSTEVLHELHRDLRRLRTLVRWWGRVGPARQRERLRSIGAHLRRLSRLVGSVRDLDVELGLWEHVHRPASDRGSDLDSFGLRLRESARTGRELLRASLRAERATGLFRELENHLARVDAPRSLGALRAALDGERGRLARATARARRRSLAAAEPHRMHDLRIRVRQLRYLTDLEDSLAGRERPSFPTRYARLQRRLGELHDRDLLAMHLIRVAPQHRASAWGRRLHQGREELRASLIAEIAQLHPRRHLGPARVRGR